MARKPKNTAPDGYKLKRPCKHCPFAPTKTRIVFFNEERATEIAESAYRRGFPCHESAAEYEDKNGESTGYFFGPQTQHCAGAIMMLLSENDEWPGIHNDTDLADTLRDHMDWKAPHFESEDDFIEANRGK